MKTNSWSHFWPVREVEVLFPKCLDEGCKWLFVEHLRFLHLDVRVSVKLQDWFFSGDCGGPSYYAVRVTKAGADAEAAHAWSEAYVVHWKWSSCSRHF